MLNTTVEQVNGHTVRLTVTVPSADVDEAIRRAYKDVAGKVKIPGFRPGKAPRGIVDTHVGRETVLSEAQEIVLDESYPKVIEAQGLKVIARPQVEDVDELLEGAEFTYNLTVEVKPELALTSREGIAVTVPPGEATAQEVDAQIEHTRERFANLGPAEGRGIEDGDFALISFTGTVDGADYEGNVVEKYLYEVGKGLMPTDFDRGLIGVEAGGHVRIEFEVPETSSNPEFVGKTAAFEVTVHEVKMKVLPELDDEFAASVGGFDTLEELKADVKAKLDEVKATGRARVLERAARAALAERLEGEVPEAMTQARRSAMLRDFVGGLEARGMAFEQYVEATGYDSERILKDIEERAALMVREELALEALFRELGMEVTEDDIAEEIDRLAAAAEMSADDLRARWSDSGVMETVSEGITHRKALEWLTDPANITITEEE
ncbi:MAG TPA: trigger factor [Coriobacteriia bacterium]|nr:trigger factor [Coriobacteriia bacterium]